jgi:dTDP-4-amino-4,6-dideoxygalactose transaminase
VTGLPAILSGTPVRAGKEWPEWPQWDDTEREMLAEVLESGAWSEASGDEAARWATEFAAFHDARHGLALTNGTHALEAAFAGCGIGEGDEVIVPALTFVATATAVLAVNATPILVDIDPGTLCIDVGAAEAAIGDRTAAVVAVHLAGTAADLDALVELCERRGLALIEDCAHAHGTRWRGRGAGSFGACGSFSFQENKLMTAGEGGALITNDEELCTRARRNANCGRAEEDHRLGHVTYGSNLRMTEWQGALLRAQLKRLPQQHRIRCERAALLDAELEKMPGVWPQSDDPRMDSRAHYAYVFHYDPQQFAGLSLTGFEAALTREGIPLAGAYPSLNEVELFREGSFGPRLRESAPPVDYRELSLPRAEHAAASTVWLDQRILLAGPEDVLDVVRAVSRIREHAAGVALRTSKPVRLGGRILRASRRRLRRSSD